MEATMEQLRFHYARYDEVEFREWSIPYWSIAAPLTLLSASLILWKPRPKPKDILGPYEEEPSTNAIDFPAGATASENQE